MEECNLPGKKMLYCTFRIGKPKRGHWIIITLFACPSLKTRLFFGGRGGRGEPVHKHVAGQLATKEGRQEEGQAGCYQRDDGQLEYLVPIVSILVFPPFV